MQIRSQLSIRVIYYNLFSVYEDVSVTKTEGWSNEDSHVYDQFTDSQAAVYTLPTSPPIQQPDDRKAPPPLPVRDPTTRLSVSMNGDEVAKSLQTSVPPPRPPKTFQTSVSPPLPPKDDVVDVYDDMIAVPKSPPSPVEDTVIVPKPPPSASTGDSTEAADELYEDVLVPKPPPPPPIGGTNGSTSEIYEDVLVPKPPPPPPIGGTSESAGELYEDVLVPKPPPPPPIGGTSESAGELYEDVLVPKPPPPPPIGGTSESASELYEDVLVPKPPPPPPIGGTRESAGELCEDVLVPKPPPPPPIGGTNGPTSEIYEDIPPQPSGTNLTISGKALTSVDAKRDSPGEQRKPPGKLNKGQLESMFTVKENNSPPLVAKKPVRKPSKDVLITVPPTTPPQPQNTSVTRIEPIPVNVTVGQPIHQSNTSVKTTQRAWYDEPDAQSVAPAKTGSPAGKLLQQQHSTLTQQSSVPTKIPDFIPMGPNPNLNVHGVPPATPPQPQNTSATAQQGSFPAAAYGQQSTATATAGKSSEVTYASVRKKYYDIKQSEQKYEDVYDTIVNPTRVDPVYEPLSVEPYPPPGVPAPPPPPPFPGAPVPLGIPAPPPGAPAPPAFPGDPTSSLPPGVPAPPPPPPFPGASISSLPPGVPAPPPLPGVITSSLPPGVPAPPPPPGIGVPAPPPFPAASFPPQTARPSAGPPQLGGLLAALSSAQLKPVGMLLLLCCV